MELAGDATTDERRPTNWNNPAQGEDGDMGKLKEHACVAFVSTPAERS